MSKRSADADEDGGISLKDRDRPQNGESREDEVGPFEDDYEDEFESEDEVMVAGEDGQPEAEIRAEEQGGT